jgi:hypothetical protein
MILTLQLPAEIEAQLREQAAAVGKDPLGFILDALKDKLSASNGHKSPELSPQEWVQQWRDWAANHPKLPFEVDDSRESIYAGCGE